MLSEWLDKQIDEDKASNLKIIQTKHSEFNQVTSYLTFKVEQFQNLPEALEILAQLIENVKQISVTKVQIIYW